MASLPHSLGLVRSGDHEPAPWKNGQGATREIARRLLGVRGPRFVWRISVSDITQDADLAQFPGVRRSMTLLSGTGATVDAAGQSHPLEPFVPVVFDGAVESHVRLTDGPVSVLNVLTVRGRMDATVRVADLSDGRPLSLAGATVMVQLDGGSTVYTADGANAPVEPLDALVPRPRVRIVAGTGRVAVVRMENHRAWRGFSW